MRWLPLALSIAPWIACESKPAPAEAQPAAPAPKPPDEMLQSTAPAPKPPDELDEKMRHCPLAIAGAVSTLADIAGGVSFVVTAPAARVAEVQRRAHHVIEFAAKRHAKGSHGAFDGKGGGRMRNCPVVTDDVTIAATDTPDGARLEITTTPDRVDRLRAESRARAAKFPFVGATIEVVR